MFLNVILILLFLGLAFSAPTLSLQYNSGTEFNKVTLYRDYDVFPGKFLCSVAANWTITPELPYPMHLGETPIVQSIVNIPEVTIPETEYTVTAITTEGSVSITFTMEVVACPPEKLFKVITEDDIILTQKGSSVTYGSDKWVCLEPTTCEFSIPKLADYHTLQITDINNTYLMYMYYEEYPKTGQLDLSNTLPPLVYPTTNTLIGHSKSSASELRMSIVNRWNSVLLYPPIGKTSFNRMTLEVKIDHHHDQDHLLVASNKNGNYSVPLHVLWDPCEDGSFFSIQCHSHGVLNITDSNNQTIKRNFDGYYCINTTELRFTALDDEHEKWSGDYPLLLKDGNGDFGQFDLTVLSTLVFRFAVLVPNGSPLKYSHDEWKSWMNAKFDDSSWKENQGALWGPFERSVVYFRKSFVVNSMDGFNAMIIDVLGWGFARIYLNGKEIEQISLREYYYSRFEVMYKDIRIGNNVIAISLEKMSDPNIVFDLSVRLVTLHNWIHSLHGKVTEEQENPTGNPENAFELSVSQCWKIQSYPASLLIDYSDRNVIVNRLSLPHYSYNSGTITAIRVEGIDGDNVMNLYETEGNNFFNEYINYRVIALENSRGFPKYRITFLSEVNNSSIDIRNLRLYRIMTPPCEKTSDLPESYPGQTVYKSCGSLYTGLKQAICTSNGLFSHWVEDDSLCLSILPPRGKAFVDFTLRIINLNFLSYNATVRDTFTAMIIYNSGFVAKDMKLLLVSDSSVNNNATSTDFMVRVTAKRSGGNYIRDYLEEFKANLTAVVQEFFSPSLDGEFVGDINMYVSVNPGTLILIIVVVVLLILYAVAFYLIIRNRRVSKENTILKDSLLQEITTFHFCCKHLFFGIYLKD